MSVNVTILNQAELALAAYSDLDVRAVTPDDLNAADFSRTQAYAFAPKWRVVGSFVHTSELYWITDPESGQEIGPITDTNGLSVTVFENTQSHERVLAIRGTDDKSDIGTDIVSIALLGSPKYQGQYQSLRAKVQEWIADGTLPQHFSVTGHSLGGFLATGLGLEFPQHVDHAYLFNAPGLGGLTNRPVLDQIARIYNITGAAYDPAKFTNVRAKPGLSMSAGLGA